ncbi:MAG: pyridoxine 5'-phosphate synthase, partial [Planctomycetota bacterium]
MIELGVNIDHVATVRQARRTWEPDPAWAAVEAHLGGADAITAHLREDRRHINDDDLRRMAGLVQIKLNLEMAATDEMVAIASDVRPQMSTLVPEGRQEITTEGGLDVAGQRQRLTDVVSRLHDAGMIVSAFIDAEPDQVQAAAACGFDACEVHTGTYTEIFHRAGRTDRQADVRQELERISRSGELIRQTGMQFNAGHGLTY